MKWQEVIKTKEYRTASPETRLQWRDEYFEEIVVPQIEKNEIELWRKDFYAHAEKLDPKLSTTIPQSILQASTDLTSPKPLVSHHEGKTVLSKKEYHDYIKTLPFEERVSHISKLDDVPSSLTEGLTPEQKIAIDLAKGAARPPPIDPVVDLVMGAGFGAKTAAKMGKPIFREAAKEAFETATFGVPSLAKGAKKLFTKPSSLVEQVATLTDDESLKQIMRSHKQEKQIAKTISKKTLHDRYGAFGTRWWDRRKKIKDALDGGPYQADDVLTDLILADGASNAAVEAIKKQDKQIFKGLSKADKEDLGFIRENLREIELGKRGLKTRVEIDAADRYLKEMEQVDPLKFQKLMATSGSIQQKYREHLDMLLEHELIDKQAYGLLLDKGSHYEPRKILEELDPPHTETIGGKKINVGSSGLEYLKTGSEKAKVVDTQSLLNEQTARIYTRVFKQKALLSLDKLAREVPDNGVVSVFTQTHPPRGYATVDMMKKGKPQKLLMKEELADQWKGLDPALQNSLGTAISWVSGTRPLKIAATGPANPFYFLVNVPKDFGYMYMRDTKAYSSHFPVFVAQMGSDYLRTLKNFKTKKAEYLKLGGGFETLSHQGRMFKKHFEKAQDTLAVLNDASEYLTRISYADRLVRNGYTEKQAVAIAKDALNWSDFGTSGKAIDQAVAYFNAGVQGSRGLLRSIKESPKQFAVKLSSLASVAGGMYAYNRSMEGWDQVSDHMKKNYWIVMTPFATTDDDGNKRWRYLSIPKDQSQRVFASIFDDIYKWVDTGKADFGNTVDSMPDLFNFLPTGKNVISQFPPLIRGIMGYAANYDYWRDREISGIDPLVKPEEHYDKTTPEQYIALGRLFDMNPKKLQYVTEQFLTSNNPIVDFLGGGIDKIFSILSEPDRERASQDFQKMIPGINRYLRLTDPKTLYREEHKEIKTEEATTVHKQKRKLKRLISKKNLDNIRDWIGTQPPTDRENLWKAYEVHQIKKMKPDDKKWWLDILYTHNPRSQAKMFHLKWKQSDPSKQKSLMWQADQYLGERFWQEFGLLMKNQ